MPNRTTSTTPNRVWRAALLAGLVLILAVVVAVPAGAGLTGQGGPGMGQPNAQPAAPGRLTWELVSNSPGVYWYSMVFPTRNVGYAVGGPDWNVNNGAGVTSIAKTTDGGRTWTTKQIAGTTGWMRGLACKDADNCWIAGRSQPRVLHTTNGGATWVGWSNQSGYPNWLWSAAWTGNGNTALAGTTCYDPADAGATANWVRTTDGQNWQGVAYQQGTYMCYVQWDIECPASDLCYSTGRNYTFRTTNGGANWKQLFVTPNTRQYGLSCTSADQCWLVGKSPHVRYTVDAGANWRVANVIGIPALAQFWDAYMVDNRHGYAVGCDNVATDNSDKCLGKGIIYRTEDGINWSSIPSPTTADIMDVWAFSASDIYVVDFSGKIWHGGEPSTPTPTPTNTPTNTPTATPTPSATPNTGSVAGIAFADQNGNDAWDDGETLLAGAVIVLKQGATEVYSATSQTGGAFRIDGIMPGPYTVAESAPPPGYERNTNRAAFLVAANTVWNFLFGHQPEPTPTMTYTPTATVTPSATLTATPSATLTATPTSTPTTPQHSLRLPLVLQGE